MNSFSVSKDVLGSILTSLVILQSITMGELYGEVDKLTMEWKDGLMAMTVRQCVQVPVLLFIILLLSC